MKGRKDLVWVDCQGVAHGFDSYERWADGTREGTTWCGRTLNLTRQDLRKAPVTCMTCLVAAARQ